MKQCSHCGAQNDDESLFCTECGKPVSQGIVCPHCGTSVNDDDVFCQNCGKRIVGEPVANSTLPTHDACASRTCDIKKGDNLSHRNNSQRIIYSILALLMIGFVWVGYKYFIERDYTSKEIETDLELATLPERNEIYEDAKIVDDAALSDTKIIEEWYSLVLDVMGSAPSDKDLDKYLSQNLKKRIWTKDYEGTYEFYRFRTTAQDSSPNGDVCKIESITNEGDGWYEVKYLDQGWEGLTRVKVEDGIIVDFVEDKSWKSWDN